MSVGRTTRVFFDGSCLIAAAGSPTGGSGFLLSLCARGLLQASVSVEVLEEAERNVRNKLGPGALDTFRRLIPSAQPNAAPAAQFVMLTIPRRSAAELRPYRVIVDGKDEHVVAAAIAAEAPFLLTLDRRLLERVNEAALPTQAISPGDFITTVLPDHPDYLAATG